MKLNRNLLLLAMAKGCMTDKELAERAGVALPTLAKIKAGKRSAKPATVGKIARALGVDVTDLIREEG